MEQLKEKFNYISKTVFGIVVSVIGFFLYNFYNNINIKMLEIQKDLVSIQISLTQLQSTMLSKDDIKEMIITEIYKYHNHNK